MIEGAWAGVTALGTAIVVTPLVRWIALKKGWKHHPDPNKWVRKANPHSIAMGGGLALWAGIIAAVGGQKTPLLILLATLALLVGLYDDLRYSSPWFRLFVHTLLGGAVVWKIGQVQGLSPWLSVPLTVFGVVGLINAVNMMDNMDGVASSVMAVAMIGYAGLGWFTHNDSLVGWSLAIAGACFGFWIYNKPPARIFMGDAGSVMLGFLLAVMGIWASYGEYPHVVGRLLAPFFLAGLFIADTTFVVLWRWTHGMPIMRGDRNHLSHRLATWLGSEWRANGAFFALQLLLVALSWSIAMVSLPAAIGLAATGVAAMGWLFQRLWDVVPIPPWVGMEGEKGG